MSWGRKAGGEDLCDPLGDGVREEEETAAGVVMQTWDETEELDLKEQKER